MAAACHWFVVPDLDGPITGGTLYNRELSCALARAQIPCAALDVSGARSKLAAGSEGFFWLDTLYLAALPELASENCARRPLGLLMHYLP
ncbi:MAG TPA: hypothetical protein VGP93_05245, partial [Polyangiaceae bacterium]|nr:hypothetical protein [Polyangiaceae bacterium]